MYSSQGEIKRRELEHIVNTYLDARSASTADLNSLVGRLLNAAKVFRHGRLHEGGVLAALRLAPHADGHIHLGKWYLRNLRWWSRYYANGGDGKCFLRPPLSSPGLAQLDASGIGYGGFWSTETTIYYFHGVWGDVQPSDLTLEADINVLELATAVWLCELGPSHFAGHGVQLDCDNMQSVVLASSFKTRREAMGLLLERLDDVAAVNHIDARLNWLAGDLNGPADALSRDDLNLFFKLTAHLCNGTPDYQDVTHKLDHEQFGL